MACVGPTRTHSLEMPKRTDLGSSAAAGHLRSLPLSGLHGRGLARGEPLPVLFEHPALAAGSNAAPLPQGALVVCSSALT